MGVVVLCEDDPELQAAFFALLRNTDHTMFLASGGIEGLKLIREKHPDVIITDISMPGLDGFQMAEKVRLEPELSTIPIIFVTGYAQKYDKRRANAYAPVEYLVKPVRAKQLKEAIEKVLGGRGPNL